jgi:Protein of unknown function (DUF3302)
MTYDSGGNESSRTLRRAWCYAAGCLAAMPADAQHLLHGEALDTVANVLALIVIVIVPVVGIAAFWLVHVLPEKIAHKRHHPQAEAIHTLCLLSLVFGGILWPLAWLWAFTKPVLYKMAYGTDKGEGHNADSAGEPDDGARLRTDLVLLRSNVERMVVQGGTPRELTALRDQLAALEPRIAALEPRVPTQAAAVSARAKEEAH